MFTFYIRNVDGTIEAVTGYKVDNEYALYKNRNGVWNLVDLATGTFLAKNQLHRKHATDFLYEPAFMKKVISIKKSEQYKEAVTFLSQAILSLDLEDRIKGWERYK